MFAQPSSLGAEVEYVSAPREYEAFVASAGPEETEEPAEPSEWSGPAVLWSAVLQNALGKRLRMAATTCGCKTPSDWLLP